MIITGTYSTVGAVETDSLEARVEWAQPTSALYTTRIRIC
jgi:hypothetical protein